MRTMAIASALALLATSALAQSAPRTIVREGPAGKKAITLDGTYCSCYRGSRKLGHSPTAAKEFCDGRPGLTGPRQC